MMTVDFPIERLPIKEEKGEKKKRGRQTTLNLIAFVISLDPLHRDYPKYILKIIIRIRFFNNLKHKFNNLIFLIF